MALKKDQKKPMELLAPAGSLGILKAVAAAGADAVYAAGERFGARAYANNLTKEELLWAIDYLHLHGKRLYLTVNTLLKEQELYGELYEYLLPFYLQGLDGVIVQDLGVLSFVRAHFPALACHASTQMTITGPYGAQMAKALGCVRIVPARELSLEEIRAIRRQTDLEIEVFVHGALCYCYSGQCLFSSMLGGRSGNRGRCAQPCRLPYQNGGREQYLLSMKDLCAIERLPELFDAGVSSLKIEGRMKQLEYAAGVTAIYRKYLDRLQSASKEEYRVSAQDLQSLKELGSRSGFTEGYLEQKNGPGMMAMKQPAHTKCKDEFAEAVRRRYQNQELQEKIKGTLKLSQELPAELVLQYQEMTVTVQGDVVQRAKKCPLTEAELAERIKKTGGSGFVFDALQLEIETDSFLPVGALNRLRREGLAALEARILEQYRRESEGSQTETSKKHIQESITVQESFAAREGITVQEIPAVQEDFKAREGFAVREDFTAQESITAREGLAVPKKRNDQKSESAGQPSFAKAQPQPYLAVSVRTLKQADLLLNVPFINRIYIDESAFSRDTEVQQLSAFTETVHGSGKEIYYQMPRIVRQEAAAWYRDNLPALASSGVDGFVATNLDSAGLLLAFACQRLSKTGQQLTKTEMSGLERMKKPSQGWRLLADSSLYVWSASAKETLLKLGFDGFTLPLEAREAELANRGYTGGEMILYGYLPLMVSAQCVVKNTSGCIRKSGLTMQKDRMGKCFPIYNDCKNCCNILYNSSPLSLLHQECAVTRLKAEGYRLSFTIETKEEIKAVLSYYQKGFLAHQPIEKKEYLPEYTNGHLKRGVE